jgi:hypothetical protein
VIITVIKKIPFARFALNFCFRTAGISDMAPFVSLERRKLFERKTFSEEFDETVRHDSDT